MLLSSNSTWLRERKCWAINKDGSVSPKASTRSAWSLTERDRPALAERGNCILLNQELSAVVERSHWDTAQDTILNKDQSICALLSSEAKGRIASHIPAALSLCKCFPGLSVFPALGAH